MKKNTAVVTGGTSNDVPAMACLVMNIKDTNPSLADEIVIYHDGISEKDQRLINRIFPTRFILYESPFKDVTDFGDVVTKYFSPMVFCKYECFKLLDDYECVIWTDYDVLILKDLSELKNEVQSGIQMITTNSMSVQEAFVKDCMIEKILSEYDFSKSGVCMSLFSLSKQLDGYDVLYHWCIDATKKLAKYILLPEQAIVNILFQEYNIQVKRLVPKIYSVHPVRDTVTEVAKVLHTYGAIKFWSGLHNEIWEKNYKKWLRLGGTPYTHRTKMYKLKMLIKKTFFYKIYKGFIQCYLILAKLLLNSGIK